MTHAASAAALVDLGRAKGYELIAAMPCNLISSIPVTSHCSTSRSRTRHRNLWIGLWVEKMLGNFPHRGSLWLELDA